MVQTNRDALTTWHHDIFFLLKFDLPIIHILLFILVQVDVSQLRIKRRKANVDIRQAGVDLMMVHYSTH